VDSTFRLFFVGRFIGWKVEEKEQRTMKRGVAGGEKTKRRPNNTGGGPARLKSNQRKEWREKFHLTRGMSHSQMNSGWGLTRKYKINHTTHEKPGDASSRSKGTQVTADVLVRNRWMKKSNTESTIQKFPE